MERNIGETFKYNGVTLIAIEDKNNSCKECYFFNGNKCTAIGNQEISCSVSSIDDF